MVITFMTFFCTKLFFDACCNRRVFFLLCILAVAKLVLVLVLTFWSWFHHCQKHSLSLIGVRDQSSMPKMPVGRRIAILGFVYSLYMNCFRFHLKPNAVHLIRWDDIWTNEVFALLSDLTNISLVSNTYRPHYHLYMQNMLLLGCLPFIISLHSTKRQKSQTGIS